MPPVSRQLWDLMYAIGRMDWPNEPAVCNNQGLLVPGLGDGLNILDTILETLDG